MIETLTNNGNPEDDTTNLVPAHVIETKREREQRTKLANTSAGHTAAKDEEAATS